MPSGDMTTEASQDHTMANANATTQAPDDRALQLEELINGSRPTLADPEPAARVRALADDEVETFYCGICMETKPVFDRFPCRGCAHRFCIACLVQYIQLRVAGSRVPVGCPEPGCTAGHLDREACKKLVDYDVYLAWGAVGGAITTPEAAYAGGVVDGGGAWDGRCAGCRRKQGGKEAVERREEEEEEGREAWTAELRELAAARGWRRCPECGVLIEKISGCNSMRCRCDCKFCYSCGLSLPRKKSTIRTRFHDEQLFMSGSFKKYTNLKQQVQLDKMEAGDGKGDGGDLDLFFEDMEGPKDMRSLEVLYRPLQEAMEQSKMVHDELVGKDLRARMDDQR